MSFSTPLALLLLPLVLGGAIWVWAGRRRGPGGRRRAISLTLRLVIFTALILSLAGATWQRPQQGQTVAFVSDLSASTLSGQDAIARFIDRALHYRGHNDQATVVAVGQDAVVEQPPAPLTGLSRFESVVEPAYTNLEAGLGLGGALLPSGTQHREVLITDGRENLGDAAGEARLLRAEGIRVDVVPVPIKPGPDARVDSVDVPSSLHIGERFTLAVQVSSTVATTAAIQILEDGKVVEQGTVAIQKGSGTLSYTLTAHGTGLHTYRAVIEPAIDSVPQNNEASAFTNVTGPPRVLVVEGYPGAGHNAVAALTTSHIEATTIAAYAVTPDLSILQRYAAIVLADVPADELGQQVMTSLRSYVGDLGHGLVALGGTNSFGVGNYGSTPLEEVLPVRMDLPKRKDLPTAAVVLIIESLESDLNVDISKRAGEGVVGLLNPQDLVAVSSADTALAVPLQHVTNKAAIDQAIERMQPQDPMSYMPYLQQAFDVLKNAKAQTKHIILLGDGDAQDAYQPLLKKIAASGIQVSTIETNAAVAQEFQTMQDIARWGKGKYYPADNVTTIPRIFLKVARTVAHSSIIEGKFFPVQDAASPILSGITAVPVLSGYVVTTPKPLSTVVLASPKSDPILAQWQYGLGRAVAWTSDSEGRWSANWLSDPATKHIWSSMVNWVLPPPQSGQLSLASSAAGGLATIGVDTHDAATYRSITAHVVEPQGTSTVTLQPTAPNHYEAKIPAGKPGAYLVTVQARTGGRGSSSGQTRSLSGGLVVPYAPDYRDSGVDRAKLDAIAAAGGGSVLTNPAQAFANNLPPVTAPTSLQWPLLLLALLLLPIDVAARRLVLGREDWQAVLAALPRRRRVTASSAEPAFAPLAAVRRQRTVRSGAPARSAVSARDPAGSAGVTQMGGAERASIGSAAATTSPASSGTTAAADATRTTTTGATPARDAPRPVAPVAGEVSSASKLLDAKRRRHSP